MKTFIVILTALFTFLFQTSIAQEKKLTKMDSIYIEANKHSKNGDYKEYIRMMDVGIKELPENKMPFLVDKMNAQLKLELHIEALETAIQIDKLDGERSANKPLNIAQIYLRLNDTYNAFKWLQISVDRGFQNYFVFEKYDIYKPIRDELRLSKIILQMKKNIGFGKPVKEFTRKSLKGEKISISDYKDKVVFIDFWATWCPPCIAEFPNLKRLHSEFKDKGFEIIGISVDSDKDKLDKFLKKENPEWPIIFSGKGWKDKTKELYGVQNVPSTWLVDKKGNLRYFCLKGDELRTAINELLSE